MLTLSQWSPLQVDVSRLSVGDLVWKNRDPALEAQLRSSYEGKAASELRKTHVQVRLENSCKSTPPIAALPYQKDVLPLAADCVLVSGGLLLMIFI
jgi:hypothetical protein